MAQKIHQSKDIVFVMLPFPPASANGKRSPAVNELIKQRKYIL